MQFTIFQDSRRGSRKINQDRVAYSYSRDALLLVCADGMGGHFGGEIAAQIVVRLLVERFQGEAQPTLKNPLLFLQDTMLRAHSALGHYARQLNLMESPRTTCVACIIQHSHAYWVHVGDSRLYLIRDGRVIIQTRDHSKVQYLVDQGVITREEAASHPDRNKIYSCLGGSLDPVIDLSRRTPILSGDVVVLCTDGVWSHVQADEFCDVAAHPAMLAEAPKLMTEAERRGGTEGDNLSVIMMRWGPELSDDLAPTTTITETMPAGQFATQVDRPMTITQRKDGVRELTDDEIEKAISEIQATIKRYGK
jgi:serine/threonine protein phosphatase PrpC